MDEIINIFLETPMLMTATIVFFLCVIIGFFGNIYLKRNNTTKDEVDIQAKSVKEENKDAEEIQKDNKTEEKDVGDVIETTINNSLDYGNQNNKDVTQDAFINPNDNKMYNSDDDNINNIF